MAFTAFRLDLHAAARFGTTFALASTGTRILASLRLKQPESCLILDATFMSFDSPSETIFSRGPPLILFRRSAGRSHLLAVPASARDSSLGVAKDPLRRTPHCLSTPASSRSRKTLSWFRQQLAKAVTRSVLAVPPDFNGLLQAVLHGLVASRCRSWGSPRFRSPSHVCRAGNRTERSKSFSCRVRCLTDPKAIFNSWFRLVVPEGTRGVLRELSVKTEVASSEDGASSSVAPVPIPKDRIQRCFRWLPESGLRLRPRLVAPNPEVLCSPMRQLWIVNHSQWCIHPSKLSPHHQQTSGQCVVRKPHDHPVVLPSRRCSQASLPLPPPLPKKKCQLWSFFPVLDLKALFQRRVRCIGCELPHSQCPLLPWASALSFDVQFPDSFQHQGVGPKSLPTPPPARLSSHLLPEGHGSSLRRCGLTFHRSERNPSKLAFTTTRVASPTTDTFSSELESLPEADVRDRRRSVARPTNSSTRKWSI